MAIQHQLNTCNVCGESKDETEHYANSKRTCKECCKSRVAEWRKKNPQSYVGRSKRNRKTNPYGVRLAVIKKRAKAQGLAFDLDKEWLEDHMTGVCAVTGLPFSDVYRDWMYPEIDKIVPEKGYVKSNCRAVCTFYNQAKRDKTDKETLDMMRLCVGDSKTTQNDNKPFIGEPRFLIDVNCEPRTLEEKIAQLSPERQKRVQAIVLDEIAALSDDIGLYDQPST